MSTKKILVLAIVVPVVLGVLGVGGYYGSQALMQNDAANNKDLEKFGFAVLPHASAPTPTQSEEELKDIYKKSTGVLGATQEVATFADDKLSPTQKESSKA